MKKFAIAIVVAALLGVFALAGCSAGPLVIGEEAEGTQAIEITNSTEKDITNIAIKNSNSSDYEAGLMGEGTTWAAGQTATLNVALPEATDPISADDLTLADDDPARDILLRDSWDIQLTFADGSTAEMHNLLVNDIAKAELVADGDAVSMKYTSKESGEEVDSKAIEEEYQAAKAAEDEAKAEAEKKAEEEAAAAAAAEAEAAAAAQAQSYSYDYSSGGSGGGSVSQSGDSCVEGGVALR
ncbi:MAG: hypothetical protein ACOYIP_03780 [Coriobacteriales bacterium]|jgi:hypothetical protein